MSRRNLFGRALSYERRRMTWQATGYLNRWIIGAVIAAVGAGIHFHGLSGVHVPSLHLGSSAASASGDRVRGRITKVSDGDTIWVTKDGGGRVKVRMIGMDAPESYALRYGHVECGGKAASDAMKALAKRYPQVTLVNDPTQDSTDKYHRDLAYVVPRGGGPTLQEHMLEQGWAAVYVYDHHPFKRVDRFNAAAAAAKSAHRGVWATCDGNFHRAAS